MKAIKLTSMVGIFMLTITLLIPSITLAADKADIDKLTTYAVILGRAIGCGINTDEAMRKVGAWMDLKFPPGSSDQKIYLPVFLEGVKHNADQQANGNSPDTCSQVRDSFEKIQWP